MFLFQSIIYNHFNGKRSTDITNNDIVDKYLPGNNREYLDYIHKKKEFELFNRRFLENKNNLRESERNKLILKERHQMDEANKYFIIGVAILL